MVCYMCLRAKLKMHKHKCSLTQIWLWIWWRRIFQWSYLRFFICISHFMHTWTETESDIYWFYFSCCADSYFCVGQLFLLWVCGRSLHLSFIPYLCICIYCKIRHLLFCFCSWWTICTPQSQSYVSCFFFFWSLVSHH